MKRTLAGVAALSTLLIGTLVPTGNAAEKRATFALKGESRALELSIGGQGLTLGFSAARADSTPSVEGVGAGQCEILGTDPDPSDLPCNESTIEYSTAPGQKSDTDQTCAGPAIPAPLDSILRIDLACGMSTSAVLGGKPSTTNQAKIAEAALEFDVGGVIPQAEDAKEQLIDQLQDLLGQAPDQVKNALNQLTDALDAGQAGHITLGPSSTNIKSRSGLMTVESTSAGAKIGVVGIPDLDVDGVPIPGTSNALEDGLIIIEIGASSASASINGSTAKADASASSSIATIKVRDITQPTPTYTEIPVPVGQSVTILEGTPAESTITAAGATTNVKGTRATAAADAVRLHLLKGVQGGIIAGLGRATAAVNGAPVPAPPVQPQVEPRQVLPVTGGVDRTSLALVLLALAFILVAARRATR